MSTKVQPVYTSVDAWNVALRQRFIRRMRNGKDFTSEDIRVSIGLPPGVHPNKFGSAWRALLAEFSGQIVVSGLRRSKIRSAKGRTIIVYRGVR